VNQVAMWSSQTDQTAMAYLLLRSPLEVVYSSIEANPIANIWACNLPWVAVLEPDVWHLLLKAFV